MSSLLILSTFNANNMRLATKEDASLANLPEELILQIISPFNQGELAKISYTCKRLAFILEKPLYTSVTQTSWTTLPLFVRSLIDRPELANHVKHLNVLEMRRLKKRVRAFNYVGYINEDSTRMKWMEDIVSRSPLGHTRGKFLEAFRSWQRDPLVAFILMICVQNLQAVNLESLSPKEDSWFWSYHLIHGSFKYRKNKPVRQVYLNTLESIDLARVSQGDTLLLLELPSVKNVRIHGINSGLWGDRKTTLHSALEGSEPCCIESLSLIDSQTLTDTLKHLLLRCPKLREFTYNATIGYSTLYAHRMNDEVRQGLLASRLTLQKVVFHETTKSRNSLLYFEGPPLLRVDEQFIKLKELDVDSRSMFARETCALDRSDQTYYDMQDRMSSSCLENAGPLISLVFNKDFVASVLTSFPPALERLTIRHCSHAVFGFMDALWEEISRGRITNLRLIVASPDNILDWRNNADFQRSLTSRESLLCT